MFGGIRGLKQLLIIPILLLVIIIPLSAYSQIAELNINASTMPKSSVEDCLDAGRDDGGNSPFNQDMFAHCGNGNEGGADAYYKGFIEGCLAAHNFKEVCEQATDAE